jgi:hypothetical protein
MLVDKRESGPEADRVLSRRPLQLVVRSGRLARAVLSAGCGAAAPPAEGRAAAPAAATRSRLLRQALMSPCGLKTNFLAAPLSKSS